MVSSLPLVLVLLVVQLAAGGLIVSIGDLDSIHAPSSGGTANLDTTSSLTSTTSTPVRGRQLF